MRIALLGYGKMGRLIEQLARQRGDEVVCKKGHSDTDWAALHTADVAIDFSHPDAVLHHVTQCALQHKNIVIGTTGWLSQLPAVKELCAQYNIGVLYSPNFSLGALLFLKLLAHSGLLLEPFPEYQAAGFEIHHSQKKDAPSGTALAMREALQKHMPRQKEVPLSSIRVGSVAGKHTLLFDSPYDTLSISHEAKNREGFAAGALKAADWLIGKSGFYTLNDMNLS